MISVSAPVSRYTSTKEVLVKLVQQLLEHDGDGDSLLEEMDNQSLRWMLLQRLRRMSFFIVVDNLLPDMDFESFLIDLARSGTFVYISYLKLIMHDRTHSPLGSNKTANILLFYFV